MRSVFRLLTLICLGVLFLLPCSILSQTKMPSERIFKLPEPMKTGVLSVEEALNKRRSVRAYEDKALELSQISQLLWAAQGRTGGAGLRTAPSAGALYPIEIFVVAGQVDSLSAGVYQYLSLKHKLKRMVDGDKRMDIYRSALKQNAIRNAPVILVLCGVYERTTQKYGERGKRYVHIEVGHVGQNIYLQSESLGLGTVVIGAFDDRQIQKIIGAGKRERPMVLIPVGWRK